MVRVITGQSVVQVEDTGHVESSTNTNDYTFQYNRVQASSVEDTSLSSDKALYPSHYRYLFRMGRTWVNVYNEE